MTIYKNSKANTTIAEIKELNERQVRAVEFVTQKGRITNKDYQTLNNISREMATIDLRKLVEMNILTSSGVKGAGAFYVLK